MEWIFFEGKDMNLQFSTPLIKSNTLSVSPSISTCNLVCFSSAAHSAALKLEVQQLVLNRFHPYTIITMDSGS